MPSQWLARTAGLDSRSHARQLRQSWERLLALRELKSGPGPELTGRLRQPIVESWKRSLDTGLDPLDLLAPLETDAVEMAERWAAHPLGSLAHVLLAQLGDIARESESLIVVSDASGLLLHIEGPESLKTQAAEMNFVEGARYSETAAGTNGIGTVLAADHALQVFASEHFNERHHGWTCSAAPVHDPVSRRVLGVVDLSGPWQRDDPLSLEFATAAAQTLEQCLADARLHSDARLRRRYADLATRATDLLVSPDGYVLAGERLAASRKPLTVPEGGGEILLGDGSFAAAEPLGHGEAYLVRRTGRSSVGAAPTEAAERADEGESGRPSEEPDRRPVSAYFEAALDCVIIADASGRVVEFNPAAERTFGYSRAEAIGRTMAELIVPPALRERHSTAFARFVETGRGTIHGRRLELTGMRADGSEFPVELAVSQVEGEPFLVCGALRDISAAKRAERHLRELAEEQAALRRVATLVARESSPRRLFALVAEQVARIIDVPLVRLVRYESDGSAAELIGGWAEGVESLALGTRWPLDRPGVLASVWRSGLPARRDYTDVPGQDAVVRKQWMRSAVASPITVEGRLWGAIAVLSRRLQPLPESTEVRLADFTELVATALANAEARAELAASEARARNLAEEQAALRRVATLVANESSPDEIFAVVAQEVGQVLCVPIVALMRYETDESAIRVVGGWSESAFPVPIGTSFLLGGASHFSDVWATGRPARLDDPADLPGEIAAAMRQAGVRSGAASPIVVEGRIWGAMAVGATEVRLPDRLRDDTEARLADFTELVGTAIANAESRAGLRRLAGQQAALGRVATLVAKGATGDVLFAAVAREVASLFGVSMVSIDRYADGESIVLASLGVPEFPVGSRWPLDGPGVRALVYETRRPARVDDFSVIAGTAPAIARAHGIESAVAFPIVVDGKVWGVLGIGTRQGETLLGDVEQHLAAFTELVSTAIANGDARDQVSRLLDEQSALRRVATLVAQGASAGKLFSAVAQEVAGVIGIPVVGVHRYEPDATFTMVGGAGGTSFTVGSRWPVEDEGLAGMILASGRPARKDDYSTMPGAVGAAVRDDGMVSMVGVPIIVDGGIWGFMVAGGGPRESIPAGAEQHLARFTELVATAVSNITMRAELAASRARVIAAADEARRRIERDLHDGAQQQLVTLALGLRAAEGRVPAALGDIRAEVGRFADRLTSVVEELREMSRGIHPAVLTQGGLSPAVEALALRSPVPVELNVRSEHRLPDGIEVAVYYVVSEALTNAAKHADASRVQIDLQFEGEKLSLSIVDDGVGGADLRGGSGLIGLQDRVEALGGTIDVASPPGSGTRLDVEIPLLAYPSVASNPLSPRNS